jgi:hypothetical protein
MQKSMVVCTALVWGAAAGLLSVLSACNNGDDSTSQVPTPKDGGADASLADARAVDASTVDAGQDDASLLDATLPDGGGSLLDASSPDVQGVPDDANATGEAGPPPARLLLSNNASQSELVAFNVGTGQVDGRLIYPGFIGTTAIAPGSPWLLEQAVDVVARLDPVQPWKVASSWNVALNDRRDGGDAYADPDAVVVGAGSKSYVLRYTRNEIAVIDSSVVADGGAPLGTIDLSGQVQAAGDGIVEMSAGVYVPSKQLVYVLLGNIDRANVSSDGYTLLCANTHPTVVAIDVTTDTLVDLNGAAPGMGLALSGYNPGLGQGTIAYDAQSDRLLVLEGGCNQALDGGGAGALVGREVEELSLFTGQSQKLLDLNTQGFPSEFIYVDANRAILQFDFSTTYAWDPTSPALGPLVANAPDSFAWDGVANLLGIKARYDADSGAVVGYDVISVRLADGLVTKLGADPFSLSGGFPSGVQLWPSP